MKYTAKHLIVYILLSFCGCAVLSAQSKTKKVCLYGTVHNRMTGELLSGVKAELMTRDSSVVGDCCTEKYFQVGNTLCPWHFYVPKKRLNTSSNFPRKAMKPFIRISLTSREGTRALLFLKRHTLNMPPKSACWVRRP